MPAATPLQPTGDLATRQILLQKALERAQALQNTPLDFPGTVKAGNQIVKPHWSQYLTPILQRGMGDLAVSNTQKEQAALGDEMQNQMQQWIQGMPTEQTALDATPQAPNTSQQTQSQPDSPYVPGMQTPVNQILAPQQEPQQQAPAAPPPQGHALPRAVSTQDKVKWAMQGLSNPMTQGIAQAQLQDALVQEPIRQQQFQFANQLNQEKIAAEGVQKMQQAIENNKARLEELKYRLEDRALDRASREAMAREALALRAQIANDSNQVRLAVAQMSNQLGHDKLAAGAGKLGATQMRELDAQTAQQEGLQTAINTLANYRGSSKGTGYLAGLIQEHVPGGSSIVQGVRDPELNRAIQQARFTVDALRHERFGSALSKFEKASAEQYLPSEYDSPEKILFKLRGLQDLLNLNHQRLRATAGEQVNIPPNATYDRAPGRGGLPTDTGVFPPAEQQRPIPQAGSLPRVRRYNPATGTLE